MMLAHPAKRWQGLHVRRDTLLAGSSPARQGCPCREGAGLQLDCPALAGLCACTFVKRSCAGQLRRWQAGRQKITVGPSTLAGLAAGQEKFGGLRDGYYIHGQCAIIMFDVTSRLTYKNVPTWHRDLCRSVSGACALPQALHWQAPVRHHQLAHTPFRSPAAPQLLSACLAVLSLNYVCWPKCTLHRSPRDVVQQCTRPNLASHPATLC